MKRVIACVFLLVAGSSIAKGQSKIGTNPASVNPNSLLELESNDKGLLLTRLQLAATNMPAPLNAFVAGMVIYNTTTGGTGATAVTPGLYYCDGTQWVKVGNGAGNLNWSLNGNSGTSSATHFLGTTDTAALILKTNNAEAVRINAAGQLRLSNVPAGDVSTDSILVQGSADNIVKKVPASRFSPTIRKSYSVVMTTGQTVFTTPAVITDPNNIMLYRNGVLIGFTVNSSTTIIAEIASVQGDEIKIIQHL